MIVGKLMVVLGLDSTGFNTGISSATGKTTLFAKASDKAFKAIKAAAKIGMLAVSAAFIKGTIDAAKFEKALANVSTMLDKTTMPMMEEFKKGILDLAESYGESTDALAKGLYDILSASIPASKAMDVLKTSAIAAKAGLTDTGVAADAITTLMNSFGDATKDAAYYSDIMFSTVKFGKCLTGDTRVLLSNGEYRRIDSLSGKVNIVSWDYKTFTPTEAKFVDMGTKQIVEIETRNGRQISTTPEHPYLTVNGWKKVSELKEGDKIAVPTTLPFFGNVIPEEGFAELLGLLLAEGSIYGSTPKLTIGNEHTDKIAREATEKYGIGYNKINQTNDRCPQYCLSYGKEGYNKKNKLTERLRNMGIWGDTCHTKKVPDEIFTWKKEYIAKFLNAYFTGDGWLCHSNPNNNVWQLGVCSVSKQLLNDISHLLLRFGINGTIRKNSNNAYMWESQRFIEIKRFMEFIGIQRDGLDIFNDHIPTRNPEQSRYLSSNNGVPREKKTYKRYNGVKTESNLLEYVAIKRIEYKDIERVYDLMVPVLHNFVANDILAHNTTFEELAPVVGNVAKLMQVAGGSAEDMAGMLAIMTRNGINTRVAVTSLRGVVSALIKPSEALTAELGGMTVEADGFRAVMDKIGSLPATDLAEMFPNVRALTGVVVAAKGLGSEVDKIKNLMKEGSPTFTAFEKQTFTLAEIWNRFKATLKATSITIGDELLPTMKEIFIGLTGWLKDNREGFATFAKDTVEGIKNIVITVFKLKEIIMGLGTAVLAVMVVQKATTAMKYFGIATSVALGPVAAIGAAVGLLIAGFFKLKKELKTEREEQELLNSAMAGSLETTEDYNDAIDIQRGKIKKLQELHEVNLAQAIKTGRLTEWQIETSRKANAEQIRNEETKLTAMVRNASEKKTIDDAEKKRLEEMSQEELQTHMDKQIRMAKELADEQEASSLRKAKEAEINMIRDALIKASETEEDRYNRERAHLESLGLSHKEIIDYLAIQYPEAVKEVSITMDAFWENEKASADMFIGKVDEVTESFKEKFINAVTAVKDVFSQMYSAITGVSDQYFKNQSSKLDNEESERKANAKATITDEDELAAALEAIDKDLAEKRYALELKQFKVNKAMNIADALMNTASAVVAALPNLILSAIVGGLGLAQVGLIASQEPPPAPSFIRGGAVDSLVNSGVFSGKSGIDTNQINVTSGEYIMPPQQTSDNIEELEAMRTGSSGKSITVNPMALNIEMEGRTIFKGIVEFMTEGSDRGEFRINPKVIGALT